MKIAGIILFLFAGLVMAIGVVVCIVTLTDDYASSACTRAALDAPKLSEARARCGSPTTECYKQATIGLTTQDECESRRSFMNRQLIMGIVPAVIGGLLAFIGLMLAVFGFVRARQRATALR